jgi:hypothetical protein
VPRKTAKVIPTKDLPKGLPKGLPRTARHRPHGEGRLPETEFNGGPKIPSVPRYRIDAVEAWLYGHRNVRRPLNVAAPLLALVCALYHNRSPFPARRRVAAWLRDEGHAAWQSERPNSVDKAITVAVTLDEIEIRWADEPSEMAGRPSVVRRRYLVPSQELLAAYDAPEGYGRGKTKPVQRPRPGIPGDRLIALLGRKATG